MAVGDEQLPGVRDSLFTRTIELFAGIHIEPGNTVEVLANGATYPRLWQDIRSAQQTLTVQDVPVVLTHRWNFNDTPSSGIVADTFGANGTPQGAFNGNGTEGVFDGVAGTYVLLPQDLFIDYNSITFEVWFTDTGTANWGRLIDIGNGTSRYMYLDAHGPNNNVRAAFNAGSGEDPAGPGRLLMQTRSPNAFLSWLIPNLPFKRQGE